MPENAREIEPIPDETQLPILYVVAVASLAAVSLVAILGLILLSWTGKTIPDGVNTLGGVALGALAGMVVVSRK